MLQKMRKIAFIISIAMILCVSFADGERIESGNGSQNNTSQPVTPKFITTDDLKKLRWIEGTWRDTGDAEKPVYVRYYFKNDSTLIVEEFDDETLSKVMETFRFELKNGRFGNVLDEARWVATELTDDAITFMPVGKALNSIRWQKEADGSLKDVLDFPAGDNKPASQLIYRMKKWAVKQ
jgi:hypothetical protein